MYTEKIPVNPFTTTIVHIRYDCCGKVHKLKWKDANKNFIKNKGKHICRSCWLKSDDNPAKEEENTERAKKTNMERYGVSVAMNTPELIEERRQQVKDPEWLAQWNEKCRQISLEKYGVEHPSQSEKVKEKQRLTTLENWGVENPSQNEEIRKKRRDTCVEKYGVENAAQNLEVREKMYSTTEERFGVRYYNQLPEMREYLRKNCREWLAESWENPWSKGVPKSDEQKQKTRETVAAMIAAGEFNGGDHNSKKGRYFSKKCITPNPMYRSSYELITHIWLDENKSVDSYEYEPFFLTYDKSSYYFPDFLVRFSKGKFLLLEIKNDYAAQSKTSKLKEAVAKKFANEKGWRYEQWLNDKISSLNISIEQFRDRYFQFN